jgi:carbon monoxide dehydrogenase subunit G
MHIVGNRRVLAPRHRVWLALQNSEVLETCLPGGGAVTLSGSEIKLGAPVNEQMRIVRSEPDMWLEMEGEGGRAEVRLADDGPLATLLAYDLESSAGDESLARAQIDRFLDAFQDEIAGPPEVAADGNPYVLDHNLQAQPVAATASAPRHAIAGRRVVFWGGTAVFAVICVFILRAYL